MDRLARPCRTFANGERQSKPYTHAGVSQLGRRFHSHGLTPTYDDGEIIGVIRVCTSAVWMVTNLVTKHLGFTAEAKEAEELDVA